MKMQFKNLIAIALVAAALLPAAALAQQPPPPPYPTAFWVMGKITSNQITDKSGFTVIFYKEKENPKSAYATATTDQDGKFLINAHDDLLLIPLVIGDYFIGVGSKEISVPGGGSAYYGVNETMKGIGDTDLAHGYKDVDELALVKDEGVWVPPGPLSPPTITSIDPNNGTQGETVKIINLEGKNFYAGASVELTQGTAKIEASDVAIISSSLITCTIPINEDAATGSWDLKVTNTDGQSAIKLGAFTIFAKGTGPTITAIYPLSDYTGQTVILEITGTGFVSDGIVKLALTGQKNINPVAGKYGFVNEKKLGPTFDLTGAQPGKWTVMVTANSQTATYDGFTILAVEPLKIKTDSLLPPAYIDQPYSAALKAAGGVAPYSWNMISGLPSDYFDNFNFDSTAGTISGTPKKEKKDTFFKFTAFVYDALNASDKKELAIPITEYKATGKIYGTVDDESSKQPLKDITVAVKALSTTTNTDQDGKYAFDKVPIGTYTVNCTDSKGAYSDAFQENVTVTENGTIEVNFSLTKQQSGPILTLTVLLQGFYKADQGKQVQTTVLIEAREVPAGATDVPGNATVVAGTTTIPLNQNNNTAGQNGFGTLAEGNYYLVVKHLKGGVSIHLPVITKEKVHIPGVLTLSTDKALLYTPDGLGPAVYEKDGKCLLWVGDMNGNKIIDSSDYTVWLEKTNKDKSSPVADLNGSGGADAVDSSDYTLWLESRNKIGTQSENQSYVP